MKLLWTAGFSCRPARVACRVMSALASDDVAIDLKYGVIAEHYIRLSTITSWPSLQICRSSRPVTLAPKL